MNPESRSDNLYKRGARELHPSALDDFLSSHQAVLDRSTRLIDLTRTRPNLLTVPGVESAVKLAQSVVDSANNGKLSAERLNQLDQQIKEYLALLSGR